MDQPVSWEMLLAPELLQSVWSGCRHSLPLMSDQEKLQLITLLKAPPHSCLKCFRMFNNAASHVICSTKMRMERLNSSANASSPQQNFISFVRMEKILSSSSNPPGLMVILRLYPKQGKTGMDCSVVIAVRALGFLSGNKNCQQLFCGEFGLSELCNAGTTWQISHSSKWRAPGPARLDDLVQEGEPTPVLDCTIVLGVFPLCVRPQIPVSVAQLASHGPPNGYQSCTGQVSRHGARVGQL